MTFQWVDDQHEFDALIDSLAHVERIALDTEFHRERTYFPKLALVQIAWEPGQLVLIDALALDVASLSTVFESATQIVIHASSQDLEVLRLACGTIPTHLFDTQIAAGFLGYSTPSLASLHADLLDMHLDKGDRLTDWLRRPLAPSVLDYAAGDVRHLLEIADRLTAELTERGRMGWVMDECEVARVHGMHERDPMQAWKKVKDARRLAGKAAGVAQSVAAWREARAAELDIPVRFVLGDLALVGIAQRPPTTLAALRQIRGVDARAISDEIAHDLLAAVEQGIANGPPRSTKSRKPVADARLRPAVTLLSSWLTQCAKEQHLDTQMLATRSDLEDFVAGDQSGRLATGWRAELVGIPMRALLDGNAALAFEPDRGIILEPRSL